MMNSFFSIIKKITALFMLVFFVACASSQKSAGPVKPKSMVPPWEYYAASRPAVIDETTPQLPRAAAIDPMSEDTKSDKRHMILIGTLVGVVVVGGVVAGVMLAK